MIPFENVTLNRRTAGLPRTVSDAEQKVILLANTPCIERGTPLRLRRENEVFDASFLKPISAVDNSYQGTVRTPQKLIERGIGGTGF
jgi:hypothetical protein